MRVSCLQENLAKGLSIVSRAVSTRSTLPVLGNILIEARGSQLRLAATNLEIGINCWIGAKVDDEGAITVPARLLSDFVNSLPPERVEMELSTRTQTLHLRCARIDANLKGIDSSDFPIMPTISGSIPHPFNKPRGCPFHPRCPQAMPGKCDQHAPSLLPVGERQLASCFLYHDVERSE